MHAPMLLAAAVPRPAGLIIDTHIHLFAADPVQFPYAPDAPYRPTPAPLADYLAFVSQAKIDHTILVHPEPYQDDHRYLEYCFRNESPRGLFKGTCLFDPVAAETPHRLEELVRRNPGRIVAYRIHEMGGPGTTPTRSGAITGLATWATPR